MDLIQIYIAATLFVIMFLIGTTINMESIKQVASNRKSFYTGLSFQMIFLPVFAFIFCSFLPIRADFKIGIVILSLCPGGISSNLISFLLDLKTTLSVCLTSINSFLILFTIPGGLYLAYFWFEPTTEGRLGTLASLVLKSAIIVVLPIVIGILVNSFKHKWTNWFGSKIKPIALLLLISVFAIKLLYADSTNGNPLTSSEIIVLLPITLTFHLISMLASFFFAKLNRIEIQESITIGIEVGLQNTALAILIASVFCLNDNFAKPALIYGLFSFFTTYCFGYLMKQRNQLTTQYIQ